MRNKRRIRRRSKRYHHRMKFVSWVWNDHTMRWREAGNMRARDEHNGFVNIDWGVRNQAAMLTPDDAWNLSMQMDQAIAKLWGREVHRQLREQGFTGK